MDVLEAGSVEADVVGSPAGFGTRRCALRARPSGFAATKSMRSLRTHVGAPMASMNRCRLGRNCCCGAAVRRRFAGPGWASRARSNRCAVSASSSLRACAMASSTSSDTPVRLPLQPGVVVNADGGKGGNLFTAQPWHPAVGANYQIHLLRRDFGPSRPQELAHVVLMVHVSGYVRLCVCGRFCHYTVDGERGPMGGLPVRASAGNAAG